MKKDWSDIQLAYCIEKNWSVFLKIYIEGMEKYVLENADNGKWENIWFNSNGEMPRKEKTHGTNEDKKKKQHNLIGEFLN